MNNIILKGKDLTLGDIIPAGFDWSQYNFYNDKLYPIVSMDQTNVMLWIDEFGKHYRGSIYLPKLKVNEAILVNIGEVYPFFQIILKIDPLRYQLITFRKPEQPLDERN